MDLKGIKLVVTDMDGTLLNARHQVSGRFFELQRELSLRGIRFAAASGRQYQSIACKLQPILDEVIIIAENGGLVRHRDRELLSTPLGREVRDRVLETLALVPGAHPILCGKDRAYLLPPSEAFRAQLEEYYTEFEFLERLVGFEGEIMKVAVYHFESAESFLYPAVKPFEGQLKVKVSGAHWVDLSDPLAHKGHALELVQQYLGITPGQTLAFGDYNNDLEMLERAEFSFAMANAHPNVLQKARYRTASNEEQGVEQVLERLLGQLG
ncbi:Cof-type HAD-IIB family hydrolase [Robiginitalea marina]|uniref:Cof-type HAD-IIB family hydrolase n=1 Tax=Robiginitalea marina TaxID=2954105 RepID=A0ABT1AUY7_9FLAO|nr:HAD family hydrolase [Robiginitalea marina]MCO5723871.1 Cof-type HAD-IIB family hydrolase [Robiginitalea marina]